MRTNGNFKFCNSCETNSVRNEAVYNYTAIFRIGRSADK